MPLANPPTLSGDTLSINRLLQSPAAIARRLRTFQELRFVSDQLLTQRFNSQGGAVLSEMSESSVTDRTVEAVAPGSEYPYANTPAGTAALSAIANWGQKVKLTDKEIARNQFPGSAVDKALRKVVNTIISQVDSITMSAIYSAVTATFDVTGGGGVAWTNAAATFLRDILRAKAAVVALNQGYMPDTLGLNDIQYAYLMSDEKFTNALQRETSTTPVHTGQVTIVAGLVIVVSPSITNPLVADATQLGGMADEKDGAPGYAVSDLGVEVKSIRSDGTDSYDLQGRRATVPVVQEPGAAIEIINAGI